MIHKNKKRTDASDRKILQSQVSTGIGVLTDLPGYPKVLVDFFLYAVFNFN
jgi:hypothetical protein